MKQNTSIDNLESIELHDAIIKWLSVDYLKRHAAITLECYKTPNTSVRTLLEINFYDVQNFSQMSDLIRIRDNSRAGNINYWIPATDGIGASYIYLVDGCISIVSGRIEATFQTPD